MTNCCHTHTRVLLNCQYQLFTLTKWLSYVVLFDVHYVIIGHGFSTFALVLVVYIIAAHCRVHRSLTPENLVVLFLSTCVTKFMLRSIADSTRHLLSVYRCRRVAVSGAEG